MQDSWSVRLISWYLYVLCGVSLVVLISPLIVVSVPVLVLLGPPCLKWLVRRHDGMRLGAFLRWWLAVATVVLTALPVAAAGWLVIDQSDRPPSEIFPLLLIAAALAPFAIASITYANSRWRE